MRFTPTRVGTIAWSHDLGIARAVHPHTRGDHSSCSARAVTVIRFTPTRVGTMHSSDASHWTSRGSPPHAWGPLSRHPSSLVRDPVHPHTRGDHTALSAAMHRVHRFTPTRVGTMRQPSIRRLSPSVHPHTRGDHHRLDVSSAASSRFTPTRVGTIVSSRWISPASRFTPTRVGTMLTLSAGD